MVSFLDQNLGCVEYFFFSGDLSLCYDSHHKKCHSSSHDKMLKETSQYLSTHQDPIHLRTDVFPQDILKSPSCKIQVWKFLISSAAEMPVKLQSDTISITSNLVASSNASCGFMRVGSKMSYCLVTTGPGLFQALLSPGWDHASGKWHPSGLMAGNQ